VIPVLVDIVGWLLKSKAASTALSASMSGIGAAGKGIGGLLAKAAPMAGSAAAVVAAGAAGYYGTKAILKATGGDKKVEAAGRNMGKSEGFNSFVEGLGNLIGSQTLIDAARGNSTRNAFDAANVSKPKATQTVNNTDNRQISISIDAKGADADEVARKVQRALDEKYRAEGLASYG
jgi:hypothetical protein